MHGARPLATPRADSMRSLEVLMRHHSASSTADADFWKMITLFPPDVLITGGWGRPRRAGRIHPEGVSER